MKMQFMRAIDFGYSIEFILWFMIFHQLYIIVFYYHINGIIFFNNWVFQFSVFIKMIVLVFKSWKCLDFYIIIIDNIIMIHKLKVIA